VTHTIKAKTLRLCTTVTCDWCLGESEAEIFIAANGDGLIAEMTMPSGWVSDVVSKPEDGADGEVNTRDRCPSCAEVQS